MHVMTRVILQPGYNYIKPHPKPDGTGVYTPLADDLFLVKAPDCNMMLPLATGSGRKIWVKCMGKGECTIIADFQNAIDGEVSIQMSAWDAHLFVDAEELQWVML